MNEYEITKLKKELVRKQEQLKEEKEDHQHTQERLVQLQAVTISPLRNATASTANSSLTVRPSRRWRPSWPKK